MSSPGAVPRRPPMATFVLLHGAASDGWYWHLVEPRLQAAGHRTIAPDLPCDDDAPGSPSTPTSSWRRRAAAAAGDDLVLVAQSMAGFTAPIVATRIPVAMIVLVAAMTPAPGESGGEWWANTGPARPTTRRWRPSACRPSRSTRPRCSSTTSRPTSSPSRSPTSRASPTRRSRRRGRSPPGPTSRPGSCCAATTACSRPTFQRRVVGARLGITPDEMDGGHLPALAHPDELAVRLLRYVAELS